MLTLSTRSFLSKISHYDLGLDQGMTASANLDEICRTFGLPDWVDPSEKTLSISRSPENEGRSLTLRKNEASSGFNALSFPHRSAPRCTAKDIPNDPPTFVPQRCPLSWPYKEPLNLTTAYQPDHGFDPGRLLFFTQVI